MLTVDGKEVIRRDYFIHRKSMRQIARERHHSRKTIRKAIYDPGVPVYTRSKPAPKVAIDPFQEVIQQWLKEDRQRPVKQRHTARRVFKRLRGEYGFPGSERTVRRVVSALRGTIPDSHVPQTYAPADGGTFDIRGGSQTFTALLISTRDPCQSSKTAAIR
jgi:transposase